MLGEFGTGDGYVRGRREGARRGGHDRGGLQGKRAGYERGDVRWTKITAAAAHGQGLRAYLFYTGPDGGILQSFNRVPFLLLLIGTTHPSMILLLDLVLFRQVDEKVTPDDDRDEGDDESGGILEIGEDVVRVVGA